MSRGHSLETVKRVLGSRPYIRTDCPFCGGTNSFSATKESGQLKWYCFKASCKARGDVSIGLSLSDVRAKLGGEVVKEDTFKVPDHFTSPLTQKHVLDYLERNHALQAYLDGLVDIRYDPKQDRCVFLIKDEGVVVDGTGRALKTGVKPKWYIYGNARFPLIVGRKPVGCIVEDAASACAISSVVTGISLQGTNLKTSHLGGLRRFSKVYVALDKDASKKGLEISHRLSYIVDAVWMPLTEDLKYYDHVAIQKIFQAACA